MLKVLKLYHFSESNWFQLGMNLGLLHPTLTAIETNYGGNTARCLMECLSKWLTTADDVSAGPLTWHTIAIALREMEENSVAAKILKISKYCIVKLIINSSSPHSG